VDESKRLAARLAALGRDVELVVIASRRHVFNCKHPAQAQYAWQVTLQWLARHLGTASVSPPPTATHTERTPVSTVAHTGPFGIF